jgi:hypothetical protein
MAFALLAAPAFAQTTNQPSQQPALSSDELKPQQNSADEAAIRSRLEDGVKPGDPDEQSKAAKDIEEAAAEAKRKSDANAGTTGAGGSNKPQ